MEALSETIRRCLTGKNITFVMGVMADKDYGEMLRILRERALPCAKRLIAEMPANSRGLDNDLLKEEILRYFSCPVETFETVQEGMRFAIETVKKENDPDAVILAFGSLYQISDIMELIG